MMDCKKALVDNDGDVEAAMEFLRKKGLASAEKKSSRAAKEGIIETYIHTGAKLGIMVEVNCETDFVAKRPEFQELAKAIAMQIAASPTVEVVSEADISPEYIAKEKKIESGSEDLAGKPPEIVEKIVEGRIAKLVKTKVCFEPCPGHTHTTCTRMHTHTRARALGLLPASCGLHLELQAVSENRRWCGTNTERATAWSARSASPVLPVFACRSTRTGM